MDAPAPAPSPSLRLGLIAGGAAVRAGAWVRRGGGAALAIVAAVLLAASLGLAERLTGPARPVAVWGALAMALVLAVHAAGAPPPAMATARRWLERVAGLPAGALGALGAAPAGPADALGRQLWARAQRGAAAIRPMPRRAAAARFIAPLLGAMLLLAAAVAAGPERLARALSPWPQDLGGLRLAVLVEPPGWTGLAPRRHPLAAGQTLALDAPRGSRVAVLADGTDLTVAVDGAPPRSRTLDAPLALRVHVGLHTLARVRLAPAPDAPPRIAWLAAPRGTPTGMLAVAWRAQDDYPGLGIGLELARGPLRRQVWPPGRWPAGDGQQVIDLARDPWAGQTVELRLLVRDGAGQLARSEAVALRLPERAFADPVAREVIAARARLLDNPSTRLDVAQRLLELAGEPWRYGERLPVFAGLSASARRLAASDTAEAAQSAADLMWEVAAAIEDGGAGAALERLAKALASLEDALAGPGADAAIRRALEELARAADEAARLSADRPAAAPSAEELAMAQALAAELADRLAAGDREGARALIAALRQSVEAARAMGAGAAGMAAAEALERASQARALAQQQRALAEQTQAGPGDRLGELAGPQGALAATAQRMGGLDAAARAMGDAQGALRVGDRVRAEAAQRAALDALDQAAQALETQAAAALPAMGRDPLGRPGGGNAAGDVRLGEAERARRLEEIRALLRERAADPERSPAERAYFLRLLRRF
jgi:hypothetical protein